MPDGNIANGTRVPPMSHSTSTASLEVFLNTDDSCCIQKNEPRKVAMHVKLLDIWRRIALRRLFHLLGECIAKRPSLFITFAVMIALLSFGMFRMDLKDRIRDGYTPITAPSRRETDVMREFWNSSGDPMVTVILLTAKDGGSMLRDEYLDEASRLEHYFSNKFSVRVEDEDIIYNEHCRPYCNMNLMMQRFKDGFDYEKKMLQKGEPLSYGTLLNYPSAIIDSIPMRIDRTFFGVKLKNELNNRTRFVGQKLTKDKLMPNTSYAQILTNMDYVKLILLLYRADKSTPKLERQLATWETSLFAFARTTYSSPLIDLQVIGTDILDQEMMRDGQRMTPFYAAGFGFMMFFVTATVLCSALFYNTMDWGKALVAFGAILCPVLSITATYGIVSLLGLRINSFMLVMPFLIMGIGVDDGFLMIHSWQKLSLCNCNTRTRLGLVLEDVGPSMTITSLTNFISFGIGVFTPTPEIRLFCFATALALGLGYLFELVLFGPILAIATRYERKKSTKRTDTKPEESSLILRIWRRKMDGCLKFLLNFYCFILQLPPFTLTVIAAMALYLYFSIIGVVTIQTRLDPSKILPANSPIQIPNKMLNDIVWAEYHPLTVIVNKEIDLRSVKEMNRFWELVDAYESLQGCRGSTSTLLWIRDYATYCRNVAPMVNNFFSYFGYSSKTDEVNDGNSTGLNYDELKNFLSIYDHWRAFVRLKDTREGLRVRKFIFVVAYANMSTWDDRINIMQKWREIAGGFKDLNVTVWEANGMFVDQMLSLKSIAIQTGIVTLICMTAVCTIFIPNPCSVISASVSIASISLGVFGFLSWWGFDLDPVIMAAVLMSVGLSVDFTAHISYHFQLRHQRELRNGEIIKVPIRNTTERLQYTLQSVGWPIILAGASTIICVIPLLFLQSYAPTVFFKTIILVVSWGLVHGLIVLPSILAALPTRLTTANCYHLLLIQENKQNTSQEMDMFEKRALTVDLDNTV